MLLTLASLPSNISLLSHIEELYISRNNIGELPNEFVKLSSLKILGLAGTADHIPEKIIKKIGKLKKLRKLYIEPGNWIWHWSNVLEYSEWVKAQNKKVYAMEKTFEKLKKLLPGLIIETDGSIAWKDH
jgi:hypothetical protein